MAAEARLNVRRPLPPLVAGRRLGNYEIGELLGAPQPAIMPPNSVCWDLLWSPTNALYGLCFTGADLLDHSLFRLPWGSGQEEATMLVPK